MTNEYLEKGMKGVFFFCAAVSVIALGAICYFIFSRSWPFLQEYGLGSFLFGTKWAATNGVFGLAPMLVGSFYVTLLALLLGAPTGIFTAVFLVFYCPKRLYTFLKPAINLMAGIPSIIYGYFGLVVLVPLIRDFGRQTLRIPTSGMSVLTASLVLGMMILPTIVTMSESALRAVPKPYYEGAVALGATHDEAAYRIVLPAAHSGVFSSIILGLGRAVGETMAVIMVAGNAAIFPKNLLSGTRTLTSNIMLEMAYAAGKHRDALIATGATLFVIILVLNAVLVFVKGRGERV